MIHRNEELCAGAQTAAGPDLSHLAALLSSLEGSFLGPQVVAKIAGHQFGLKMQTAMHLHRAGTQGLRQGLCQLL